MIQWLKKHWEVLSYLIFGVLTTLLNILLYALFNRLFGYTAANSWGNVLDNILCILFAYATNRAFVFRSKTRGREQAKEFTAFVSCRLGTMLLDTVIMLVLGSLSALGYGPLAGVTVFGMQFLDFFDFLTNSVMMPIAAITICLLVSRVIGVKKIEEEVTSDGKPFRRKKIFNFMIRYLCPIFAAIILVSSVANALGWIAM